MGNRELAINKLDELLKSVMGVHDPSFTMPIVEEIVDAIIEATKEQVHDELNAREDYEN